MSTMTSPTYRSGAERVLAAARRHGWTVRKSGRLAMIERGSVRLLVEWTVSGSVFDVTTNTDRGRLRGRRLAEQTIEILTGTRILP